MNSVVKSVCSSHQYVRCWKWDETHHRIDVSESIGVEQLLNVLCEKALVCRQKIQDVGQWILGLKRR
jgi:hypothetical protein